MPATLAEFYESGNAPHEALGRAARKLAQGGALYLGGGVGIERQSKPTGDIFRVATGAGKAKEFPGPLSAVMHGFTVAGSSTAPDTPGGASKVTDPAAAARLRELLDRESEAKKDIERYTRRLAIAAKNPQPWRPGLVDDDRWEQRRIEELKAELAQISAERTKLLSTGKVEEVEQARPGTNFTKIPPKNVAKLSGIIDHYKSMSHPFTACVRDQVKHGLSDDHAKRRCAVVKDLGAGTTKWRKGSKKLTEAAERALLDALGRIEVVEEALGVGMSIALVEGAIPGATPHIVELAEAMSADYGLLALAGHPLAEAAFGIMEAFTEGQHPRDSQGKFAHKMASQTAGHLAGLLDQMGDQSRAGTARLASQQLAAHRPQREHDRTIASLKSMENGLSKNTANPLGRDLAMGKLKATLDHAAKPGQSEGGKPPVPKARVGKAPMTDAEKIADLKRQQAAVPAIERHSATYDWRAAQIKALERKVASKRKPVRESSVMDSLLGPPLAESFAPAAQREAMKNGGKAPPAQKRSPSMSSFDEEKHPRGGKGTSAGGKFVSSGSSGENVHAVQRKVGAETDGKFGPKTKQAVMDFQRRHGLKVDGIVGHQTAVALAGNYSAAKTAKPGALKGSDRAKLRALRRRTSAGGRKGRPDRRRGGATV